MNTSSTPIDDLSDLEDLYTQALLIRPAAKSARTLAKAPPPAPLFQFPERWVRERCIALIHGPTGTLLGNFAYYTHDTVKSAHRYVREDTLVCVSGHEFVEGTWWLDIPEPPCDKSHWTDVKTITAQAILPSLHLASPAALLAVRLYLGAISRIELGQDTEFAGDDGHTLVILPAGTDIRALLSRECKIAIRQEVLGFFDTTEV
jgi:hypothetical protein